MASAIDAVGVGLGEARVDATGPLEWLRVCSAVERALGVGVCELGSLVAAALAERAGECAAACADERVDAGLLDDFGAAVGSWPAQIEAKP